MAIVDMTKFSLFSFAESRSELLDELQRFEYIHFSDTSEIADEQELNRIQVPQSLEENDKVLSKLRWLLDILEPRVAKPSMLQGMKEGLKWYSIDELKEKGSVVDYETTYKEVKKFTEEIENTDQEVKSKQALIADLKPWSGLETRIDDLKSTERLTILSGALPTRRKNELLNSIEEGDGLHVEVVSDFKSNSYIIAIILKESYDHAIEVLRQSGFNNVEIQASEKVSEEIQRLESEIKDLEAYKSELNGKIDTYTNQMEELELAYEYQSNKRLTLTASENFIGLKDVDIVQGYLPTKLVADFDGSLKSILGNSYYLEVKEAEKDDDATPVLLENSKLVQPFQSITEMYSTPRYSEIDPTPFLSLFYWIFFGMMVGDFAYGAVLFVLTGIALSAFNLDKGMRNSMKFFFMLSISTMIWGLVFGSAFGMSLPFKLLDTGNNIQLLVISVAMGAVHLFFGLALKAYMAIRDGNPMDAVYDVLLWYMTLIGATVLLLSMVGIVPAGPGAIAKWVMIVGMVGIVLFGGRSANGIASRLALGAYELYGISSWVGDFVSYSRLMALALSGGFIAVAINMIIGILPEGPIGLVAGAVIFVFGHAFNIFLSYLSAYVHDIRLTFVEFFGKFFEGGGVSFNLFKNKTKYINMK